LGSLTFGLLQTEGSREQGVWENKREYVVQVPWQGLSLGVTIARSVYLLCVVLPPCPHRTCHLPQAAGDKKFRKYSF